jgi:ketosteroid isomerase-like protein
MKALLFIAICTVIFACQPKPEATVDIEKCKKEILQTEKEFETMAAEKGIKEAFLFYAADDVALSRFNLVYKGKKQVALYFDYVKLDKAQAKLKWNADFVDVSASGDMAYTYGKYSISVMDSTNKEITKKGVFHTVWKKQKDGNWKFVWD